MFLLVLVLSFLGIGFCHEEFQCQFENKDLKISKNGRKGYEWGKSDVRPLAFASVDEMDKFLKQLNEVRRGFFANAVYNDVESFESALIALDEYENVDDITMDKVDRFIQEYVPPIASSQTNLGLLVQFLRSLGQKLNRPDIGKHVYIALKGEDLSTETINLLRNTDDIVPVDLFQYESLVGIMQIKHPKRGVGVLILNMDYPEDYVPLVLDSDVFVPTPVQKKDPKAFEEYINTYHRNHLPITYSRLRFGDHKTYIEVNTWRKQDDNQYTTDATNVIYTRPVCSVTEIQNRVNLKSTVVRSIMKYGPDFTLEAYVFARIGESDDQASRDKKRAMLTESKEVPAKENDNAEKDPKEALMDNIPAFSIGFTKDLTEEEYTSLLTEARKNLKKKPEEGDQQPPKDIVITTFHHLSEKDLVVILQANKLLNTDLQVSLGLLDAVFSKTDDYEVPTSA